MNVKEAYNEWSEQYDANQNKTRDVEEVALRETLSDLSFNTCLEIGCGTGKNTTWLLEKSKHVIAVDFSEQMLAKAKQKIKSEKVEFVQADILQKWDFKNEFIDLVSFSLVLEHIENLNIVFQEAFKILNPGGSVYIGELHPFKQYQGSKARFETRNGLKTVTCFTHHLSDFLNSALAAGFVLNHLKEYFDDPESENLPRIVSFIFRKPD